MHKKLFLYTILRELSWTSRNIYNSFSAMFKTSLFLSYQNKFGTNSATLKLSKTINRLFFFKKKKVWKIEVAFLRPLTSLEPGCDQCPTDSRASLLCSDEGLYHQNFECLSAKALSIFLSVCSSVFWKNSQQWQVISSSIW